MFKRISYKHLQIRLKMRARLPNDWRQPGLPGGRCRHRTKLGQYTRLKVTLIAKRRAQGSDYGDSHRPSFAGSCSTEHYSSSKIGGADGHNTVANSSKFCDSRTQAFRSAKLESLLECGEPGHVRTHRETRIGRRRGGGYFTEWSGTERNGMERN